MSSSMDVFLCQSGRKVKENKVTETFQALTMVNKFLTYTRSDA
jgi:hypothetical protein